MYYISKGSEESIQAYFHIFLNDPSARVVYPKESILKTDDGQWDDANQVYTSFRGKLDEAFMVLQDDDYYQIYSYVIRSGQSVRDWGMTFEETVHPAGWKYFGEVEITETARFRTGTRSPLIVPGYQEAAEPALLITSKATFTERAHQQQLYRIMNPQASEGYDSLSLGRNILNNTGMVIGDFAGFTIDELTTTAVDTNLRRGRS